MSILRYPGSRNHRGLSADLWRHSLDQFVSLDPLYGSRIFDDFLGVNTPDWTVNTAGVAGSTGHAFTRESAIHGIGNLTAVTAVDHEGVQAIYGAVTGGSVLIVPGKRTVYETLLYPKSGSNTFFAGLAEIVQILSSTSTLNDEGYIGFYRVNSGGLNFVCNNTGVGGAPESVEVMTSADLAALITAGDPLKVGVAVNIDGKVDICVNGVLKTTEAKTIEFVNVPTEYLTPRYIVARGATGDANPANVSADWVASFVQGEEDNL